MRSNRANLNSKKNHDVINTKFFMKSLKMFHKAPIENHYFDQILAMLKNIYRHILLKVRILHPLQPLSSSLSAIPIL